jgi:hypothetical protein
MDQHQLVENVEYNSSSFIDIFLDINLASLVNMINTISLFNYLTI